MSILDNAKQTFVYEIKQEIKNLARKYPTVEQDKKNILFGGMDALNRFCLSQFNQSFSIIEMIWAYELLEYAAQRYQNFFEAYEPRDNSTIDDRISFPKDNKDTAKWWNNINYHWSVGIIRQFAERSPGSLALIKETDIDRLFEVLKPRCFEQVHDTGVVAEQFICETLGLNYEEFNKLPFE